MILHTIMDGIKFVYSYNEFRKIMDRMARAFEKVEKTNKRVEYINMTLDDYCRFRKHSKLSNEVGFEAETNRDNLTKGIRGTLWGATIVVSSTFKHSEVVPVNTIL